MSLMSVAPIIPWKTGKLYPILMLLLKPIILSILTTFVAYMFFDNFKVLLIFFISSFVIFVILQDIIVEFKLQLARGLKWKDILSKRYRRYCSFLVHFGIILLIIGITLSSVYGTKSDFILSTGQSLKINDYDIKLLETYKKESEAKNILGAKLLLTDSGNSYYLYPEQNLYKYEGNREINKETEVAIYNTLKKDYYLILIDDMEDGRFNFKIYINPWVSLLWIGSLVSILGGVLIMFRRKI